MALIVAVTLSTTTYGQLSANPLVPETSIQRYGLTRAWFHRAQMDSSRDRVENITVGDGVLFVQTRRGNISSVDAETGKVHWHRRIGSVDRPTSAVGIGPRHVAALNGHVLYVMDRENGNILWQKRTVGAPGAGPAVSRTLAFVPSRDGIIQAFSIRDPEHQSWRYAAVGRVDVQPYATGSSISWPTTDNFFYVANVSTLNPRFRVQLGERSISRPVYIKPYLYMATLGGHLYKLNEQTGSQVWRFSAGSPISARPLATGERVFVATETGGVFCLAGKVTDEQLAAAESEAGKTDRTATVDGEEIWWAPRVTELLAASPTRLYGRDESGRTLILRADNGGLLGTLSTEQSDMTVTNARTDRVYLATRKGLIQCLREVAIAEPVVHANVKDQIAEAEAAEKAAAEQDSDEFDDEFGDDEDFEEEGFDDEDGDDLFDDF